MVEMMGGGTSPLLAPPEPQEPDDELGVDLPCDCGAHGTHQAQFRFESQVGRGKEGICARW